MRKVDFVKLSERHEGSRDAGAQMFCALLRSAGVEARLVCSLQALPFATVPHTPTAGKIKQTVVYAGTDSDDQIETGDEGILSSASRPASVNGDATVLATPNRVKRFYHRATGAASSVDLGKSPAMPGGPFDPQFLLYAMLMFYSCKAEKNQRIILPSLLGRGF